MDEIKVVEPVEVKKVIIQSDVVNELDLNQTIELCKANGITLDEVETLVQENREYSALEKKIKPLKEKIKSALLEANAKNGIFGKVSLRITFQNRDTMDEDRLLAIFKERGLTDAIMTVEKPNPDKLISLISNGIITDEDMNSCMIPNRIPVLNFPRVKKSDKVQNLDAKEIMQKVESVPIVHKNTGRF